jgi:hypothetical protein
VEILGLSGWARRAVCASRHGCDRTVNWKLREFGAALEIHKRYQLYGSFVQNMMSVMRLTIPCDKSKIKSYFDKGGDIRHVFSKKKRKYTLGVLTKGVELISIYK